MRSAEANRTTGETRIHLFLDLEGMGKSDIDTGVGFLDHMLVLLAKHGGFDLVVKCDGDTYVDDHHSVEDIGISLGQAFAEAIGDKRGITRYADTTLAMDEALILTSVDISGRSYLAYNLEIPTEKVGTFDTELVEEFLLGFVRHAGITLHVRQLAGKNSHHIIEGMFKSLAHTLRKAVAMDERFRDEIPSTKGILTENSFEEDRIIPNVRNNSAPQKTTTAQNARITQARNSQEPYGSAMPRKQAAHSGLVGTESGPKASSSQPIVSRGLGDGSYAKGIAKGVTQALNREEYEQFSLMQDSNTTSTSNAAAAQAKAMSDRRNSTDTGDGATSASASSVTQEKPSLKDRVLRRGGVDDMTMVQSSILQNSGSQRVQNRQPIGSGNPDQTRANISGNERRTTGRKLSSTEALEKELQEKGLL